MSADPLDALLGEALEAKVPAVLPEKSNAIQKLHYTHDAMIDLIIAQPGISQNNLALHFGYTASWVSRIIASDAFQARLAERTKEMVDPALRATIEDQFKGIVARSLDIISQKLNKPADQIPDQLALRTLEISARAAGYGAKDPGRPVAPTEMHVHLNVLGERLTGLLQKKRAEAIEGELADDIE